MLFAHPSVYLPPEDELDDEEEEEEDEDDELEPLGALQVPP